MNSRRTVDLVIIFLGSVTVVGLVGIIAILVLVILSEREFDPTLLVPLVGITTGALGGMTGLLSNTHSTDPGAIADTARTAALADVASLNEPGELAGDHFAQPGPLPDAEGSGFGPTFP